MKNREAAKATLSTKTIVIAAVVVFVIAAVAGFAIYWNRVAPFRTVVLVVNNTSFDMRYFLKRVSLSSADPVAMFETLMREEIIRQAATKPPYDFSVSKEDIEEFLKELARGESASISDAEYNEWFRQQINESRLTEAEFLSLAEANLLALRLTEYLAERVPTVAEQVHLHMILVKDLATARVVIERFQNGEEFAALAREMSIAEQLKENGGDLGWRPRGSLSRIFAETAFDKLDVGKISDPLFIDDESWAVIMVSERVPAREIDPQSLQRVKAGVLEEWLRAERKKHDMAIHGFTNGYDTETDAWVRWQLERMKK